MSTAKAKRYATLGTDSEMVLKLDPDIYDSDTCALLGLSLTAGTSKKTVPVTLAQAGKSDNAQILKVTVTRGTGDLKESRQIKLLAETQKVPILKAGGASGLEGKSIKLGGATTSLWTVTGVS